MPKSDPNPRDSAFHFEATKAGLNQTKNGYFLRLEVSPLDLPPELSEAALGQRWFVVLTPMPDAIPEPTQRELDDGDRALRFAAMLCKDVGFQHFLGAVNEDNAATLLRKKLGITSRRELKTNARARKELFKLHDDYFEADTSTL